jgi:hypothetical protein
LLPALSARGVQEQRSGRQRARLGSRIGAGRHQSRQLITVARVDCELSLQGQAVARRRQIADHS